MEQKLKVGILGATETKHSGILPHAGISCSGDEPPETCTGSERPDPLLSVTDAYGCRKDTSIACL